MIENILQNKFSALAAYTFVFSVASLLLYLAGAICNAVFRKHMFQMADAMDLFTKSLIFAGVFQLLDYFLV